MELLSYNVLNKLRFLIYDIMFWIIHVILANFSNEICSFYERRKEIEWRQYLMD